MVRDDARVSLAVANPEAPIVSQGSAAIHPALAAEVVAAFAGKYGWDITDNRRDGQRVLIGIATNRWVVPPT